MRIQHLYITPYSSTWSIFSKPINPWTFWGLWLKRPYLLTHPHPLQCLLCVRHFSLFRCSFRDRTSTCQDLGLGEVVPHPGRGRQPRDPSGNSWIKLYQIVRIPFLHNLATNITLSVPCIMLASAIWLQCLWARDSQSILPFYVSGSPLVVLFLRPQLAQKQASPNENWEGKLGAAQAQKRITTPYPEHLGSACEYCRLRVGLG